MTAAPGATALQAISDPTIGIPRPPVTSAAQTAAGGSEVSSLDGIAPAAGAVEALQQTTSAAAAASATVGDDCAAAAAAAADAAVAGGGLGPAFDPRPPPVPVARLLTHHVVTR